MTQPKRLEMSQAELEGFFERLERDELTESDRAQLKDIIAAVLWMARELEHKELSIKRLQRLFGIKTEKASKIFPEKSDDKDKNDDGTGGPSSPKPSAENNPRNRSDEKKPGGKNGADDYPDSERIYHTHESLKPGQTCPLCSSGTLYDYGAGSVIRLTGQPPIKATVHQPQQLRCSACQELFTAKLPEEVGQERADASAKAMVALFRYGSGIPFYRLEKLQDFMNTPLPDSTQWDMSESVANSAYPVYQATLSEAAQAELYNADDTGMKILHLKKRLQTEDAERTGIFTTGVLARSGEREIALFFTGNKHAGERMQKILRSREPGHAIPKMMCDALSRNKPKGVEVDLANCLDHARRGFLDVLPKYSAEVEYFIKRLGKVYHHDKIAKWVKLGKETRLSYHRKHSLPIMEELKLWCELSFADKAVEPNSPLGAVMQYFLNHYEKLTMFAKVAGIPLSNAAVERLLKTAVLHRKNSLFYLTETGAIVGDILMSLIQTAKRSKANVLDYLTQIQLHAKDVKANPEKWFAWNYRERLAVLQAAT